MTVSNNTLAADALCDVFKNLGRKDLTIRNKWLKCIKNPGRALEIGADVGSAFSSRSPKTELSSLPEVINFYHARKGLYLGNFV